MKHNPAWPQGYSKTEIANLMHERDRKLASAVKALRLIQDKADSIDLYASIDIAKIRDIVTIAKAGIHIAGEE